MNHNHGSKHAKYWKNICVMEVLARADVVDRTHLQNYELTLKLFL